MIIDFDSNENVILALGAESAGNFSVYRNGKIFLSEDFGDLLEEKNFTTYKKSLDAYLKEKDIKPKIILSDLHPSYRTNLLGEELSKKFKAKNIQVQHHLAHLFSAIGEAQTKNLKVLKNFFGVVTDGTGYGLDGNIWGGEVFDLQTPDHGMLTTIRIGHLENQTMIGGDLAVREPARMLISILAKFLPKKEVFKFVQKYYSKNEFEVLYNQLKQNFNCHQTSSTGRILDAVSVLLGFANNERDYKHEAALLLEKAALKGLLPLEFNSNNLKPFIQKQNDTYILNTTHLFKYLIKNINKNKKGLATTAQLYIAEGLYNVILSASEGSLDSSGSPQNNKLIFLSGGISKNKIISEYFKSKGSYINKKIPCGDAGISFGQIVYYLNI